MKEGYEWNVHKEYKSVNTIQYFYRKENARTISTPFSLNHTNDKKEKTVRIHIPQTIDIQATT